MNVSPTDIRRYRLCPWIWYAHRFHRVQTPLSPARRQGIENHRLIELFLEGRADFVGRVRSTDVYKYLQKLKESRVEVEKRLEHAADGVTFVGIVDGVVPEQQMLIDFKVKKNLNSQFLLDEKTILQDPGLVMYCWLLMNANSWNAMWVTWVYLSWKMTTMKQVTVPVDREMIDESMEEIRREVREMKALAQSARSTIPRNYGSCFKFGRPCDLQRLCWNDRSRSEWFKTVINLPVEKEGEER